ncbi:MULTISPECIES: restriction endonuclease subunit S [unclassified Saccharibacter]|uniref:restriction endonuclease subunit S n=1 Tax=unclassified Saccharibacter TaxID=2648722 RepID=UPI0013297AC5|nr:MULTISPECIES: restriction endonuclease subunit S [unclassified Saccharibacter]MXV35470.1 hypothetical protein [Saccharibacter sp. EH611]MXV58130.1 hypothetical protein [Saccharibacter sp. EH70]MXV65404.1 hypothetical protein [Saccharibacter sp. EH60]
MTTWPMVKLGDVVQFIRGVTFSRNETSHIPQKNHLPILRAGNISQTLNLRDNIIFVPSQKVTASQYLCKNDILMCMSSGSALVVGKSALLHRNWQGSFGAFLACLRPTSDEILPIFLTHWLQSPYFRSWAQYSRGTGIKNIRVSDLKNLPIPLPPLAEQKRIAAILDQADTLRRQRSHALETLNTMGQAIFHEMFEEKTRNILPNNTHINSKQWPMVKLGDVVDIKTGKLDANASSPTGAFPFFTCSSTPLQIDNWAYDLDAVIVAGNGDLNVKHYNGKFNAYQRTYIITPKQNHVIKSLFLYYFMNSYVYKLRQQAIGGVIKYIKIGMLTNASIPLPPLAEQERFAKRIEKVEALQRTYESALKRQETLFNALRQQAFRGEL